MSLVLSAQSNSTSDFLVTKSGDSLNGTVSDLNDDGITIYNLEKILLTDSNGKQKKYNRENVSAFRSDGKNYDAFWLNQTSKKIQLVNPIYDIDWQNGDLEFLKVLSKGKLSHYQLEWYEQGDTSLQAMDLLKREIDTYFIRATQGVFGLKRTVLSEYFRTCNELSTKITTKEFKEVYQFIEF